MTRVILLSILFLLVLSNCRKNEYEPIVTDIGHSYLPLKIGSEFIYMADSVKFGFNGTKPSGDTQSFYIKDVVVNKFDDTGKTTYTMARFHSKDSINWIFNKNHFYEVEKLRINHKENSVITTSLVFPIARYYYWNGNELNNLDPQDYEYSMINFNYKFASKIYPNCIKVKMDSTNNLRKRDIEYEIFSKDIGLVYKETIHLDLVNNDSLDAQGNIVLVRPPRIEKGIIFKKGLIRFK